MNERQQAFLYQLVLAMSSRRPTIGQRNLIKNARYKVPNLFAKSEKLAAKVRRNVDDYMLGTWEETLQDELQSLEV